MINNKNNERDMLQTTFYYNKLTGNIDFNFDIFPLIKDFDFYSFIDYAEKHKDVITDYGAFIVITPKQYVIGYNSNFGTGSHLSSFARCTKDIYGGGVISSQNEVDKIVSYAKNQFITAAVMYESISMYGVPECSGYISIDINIKSISLEHFKSFEQFYNDYNNEIKRVVAKYGKEKFYVQINFRNDSKLTRIYSDCLDELYIYLKNIIDYDKYDSFYDEIIIGKENKNKILKMY